MSDHALQPANASVPEDTMAGSNAGSRAGFARGPGAARTILLMAKITFVETVRRKLLWIAGFAGAAFLSLFWAGLHSMMQSMAPRVTHVDRLEGIGMMTMMTLYAGSMMTSLMAALIACDTLSGEIASGTIHAIATKPVHRWCLVLGKWLGFVGMMTLYVLLITGGTMAIARLEGGRMTPHAGTALSLIWLQAMVLLGVTILCSTRLSALTSGACSLGLYGLAFVGGWIEQFGAIRHIKGCVDLGILASLIMPTDALWRRVAFKVQPPILGAAGVSPFSSSAVPSTAMVAYAAVYAVLALVAASIIFERRDL
jgi:ABC-type transport system involved in multi-copper enzyme maturation permease subunit